MNSQSKIEGIRWQIVEAMLNEFPTLKEKVKKYLKESQ